MIGFPGRGGGPLPDLADLETARAAAERLEHEAQTGLDHAELLLKASEELARTSGLQDLRRRLSHLLARVGKPPYLGLLVAGHGEPHRIPDPDDASSAEHETLPLPADAAFPSSRTLRERRAVFVPDRGALVAGYGPEAVCACRSGEAAPC
ncbi:hypothetical protein ACFXB4_18255 [Streptomyces lavendulae]|uniref:hypothetical protein n=1 Tax=Streptomyces lavendulae TaxID=1914 RepID=UPI0036BBB894